MRVLTRYRNRWRESSPSLRVFLAGALLLGINNGILTATFNNYLFDSFHVNASVRGLIEFPRELPGFAMIFVTGVLAAFSLRSWAMLVGLTTGVGILGLGYLSPNMSLMIFWMMLWSLGDHLFITAEATIGLKLAEANRAGRRLGQLTGARNLSMILGTAAVWLLMDRLGVRYPGVYALAAATAILAAVAFSRLRLPGDGGGNPRRFVLKKRYTRFYLLNIFWGARKQLFLTFSPWVLVSGACFTRRLRPSPCWSWRRRWAAWCSANTSGWRWTVSASGPCWSLTAWRWRPSVWDSPSRPTSISFTDCSCSIA